MKRYITNIFAVLCAALLVPSCSTDGVDNIPEGQGLITMNVGTGTRAAGDPVDLDQCTVGIYDLNQGGALVRKYAKGNCPDQIALVAGKYRVKVQYGEKPAFASFDNCYYEGLSRDITLAAGSTETAEVTCLPQSVAVEVHFGNNFAEIFNSYAADVTLGDGVTNGSLHYTENRTGYFTLPEGVTMMTWTFTGDHKTKGTITKTLPFVVEAGKKYALGFKFSSDMPGYIDSDVITIEIGETIDWDDEFNFSNDPEITNPTNSSFFFEPQVFAGEAMTVEVAAQAAITKLSVEAAGKTYDLISPTDDKVSAVFDSSRMGATVTLNPSFFEFACGDMPVTFKVEDNDGGQAEKIATIRIEEGIMPVAEADCDLWSNTVVLRAKSNGAVPVIKMRRAGDSEWQTATAAAEGDHYAATFAPQWESSQNSGNNNIYTPMTGTGVWAANTYEVRAEIGDKVSMTSFTTKAGDVIPNAGMEEWSTWKVVGSIMTGGNVPYPNKDASTEFWVGGNNKTTNALCTGVEIEGSNGKCAQLKPKVAVGVFAAGNLFTGSFDAGTGVSDTYGNARFGVKYAFTGRPRALRFRCKINVAEATVTGTQLPEGAIDPARIFCCVVDWTERHAVKSGLQKDESTFWNPVASTALNEGNILGYADTGLITESNDWKTMEIPFVWYDKESMPTEDNYTMLISCSTSAYGDYTIGSANNCIWIEDFEWVY